MQRTVLDWYLKNDENEMLFFYMNSLLMGNPLKLFINGEPQSGKTHFLKEIEQRVEGVSLSKRKPTTVLYFTGESLQNMLQFVSRGRKKRYNLFVGNSVLQMSPPEESTDPLIIIDDIQRYPLHSQSACVLLRTFLSRSRSVIVTSNLPLAEIDSGIIFEDYTEINLKRPSKISAKRILEEFVKQHHIGRISDCMLEVCVELYEEHTVSLSELKEILFKAKLLSENRVWSTLHNENFHHFFAHLQIQKEVGKRIRDKLIAKQNILNETPETKGSATNEEQDQGITL